MSDRELDAEPEDVRENPEGADNSQPQLRENDDPIDTGDLNENPETEDDIAPHHRQNDDLDRSIDSENFQCDTAEADRIDQLPTREDTCSSSVHFFQVDEHCNDHVSGRFAEAAESDCNAQSAAYCESEADHALEQIYDEADGNNDEHYMPEDEKVSTNIDGSENAVGSKLSCDTAATEADMLIGGQNNARIQRSSSADDLQTADTFPEDDVTVNGLKLYGNIQGGEAAAEEDLLPCNITPSACHALGVNEQQSLPEDDLIRGDADFLLHDDCHNCAVSMNMSEDSREITDHDQDACSNRQVFMSDRTHSNSVQQQDFRIDFGNSAARDGATVHTESKSGTISVMDIDIVCTETENSNSFHTTVQDTDDLPKQNQYSNHVDSTCCSESSAYQPECDQSTIDEARNIHVRCEVVKTESRQCTDNKLVGCEVVRTDNIVEVVAERCELIGPQNDSRDVSENTLQPSEKSKHLSSDINVTTGNLGGSTINSLKQNVCSLSSVCPEQIDDQAESMLSSSGRQDDELLSELDQELACTMAVEYMDLTLRDQNTSPNGIVPLDRSNFTEWRELKSQLRKAADRLEERDQEIDRLKEEKESQGRQLHTAVKERDSYLHDLRSSCQDDLYIPQIKELEYTIVRQQVEIRSLKDKLATHDAAAKRAVATLQHECRLRIDQVTKMYEDVVREKDSMVVKYAQAEQKHLESQKIIERLDIKVKEVIKEKEAIIDRAKAIKAERQNLTAAMETKTAEVVSLTKELEKQKDASSSLDVRIKWSHNKLKTELDNHKETKKVLEQTNLKLKEAKEETDQIRHDCQRMIRTYQESEEIKSNSLDQKLKAKESELKLNLQEKSDQEEIYTKTTRELEALKFKHKEMMTESVTIRNELQCLTAEKIQNVQALEKFKAFSQKQKLEIRELQSRIDELVQFQEDFNRAQGVIQTLDREISELRIGNKDLQTDMDACRCRETEKLELTSKLSRKNAELQSDNINISNKVMFLTSEIQTLKMELQEMDTKYRDMCDRLQDEQKKKKEEADLLNDKLTRQTKSVEELTIKLQEEKDEIKTLKRRHVNNVKDLTRQLQQTKRKLEIYECNGERDTTSLGSRTSSNGSLNIIGMAADPVSPPRPTTVQNSNPIIKPPGQEQESIVMSQPVKIDNQVLIERIVRLQRAHARKNEKIEFMEDHLNQLVNQIQKKSRIIQSYILREESGTLTPDFMDYNKMQLSRKHSIMASLYRSHATDGTMTLDLSLEINRKLQAVLEDTLLKNITLKENLETLGTEIARLSQENRRIQLHKMMVKH